MIFGISYDDDLVKAKQVLQDIVEAEERVLKDPGYIIGVKELTDSRVNILVKVFVESQYHFAVSLKITEQVKLAFDKEGIRIPHAQQEIHLLHINNPNS